MFALAFRLSDSGFFFGFIGVFFYGTEQSSAGKSPEPEKQ